MRRSDLNPAPPGDKEFARGDPRLKGKGRTAEDSPGWGAPLPEPPPHAGEGREGAGDSEYAQALSLPPGPLTRADLPPSGGGEERLRQALFSPRSVAVIGQSNDPGKTAGRPLKFLRQAGYAGRV